MFKSRVYRGGNFLKIDFNTKRKKTNFWPRKKLRKHAFDQEKNKKPRSRFDHAINQIKVFRILHFLFYEFPPLIKKIKNKRYA